MIFVGIDPGKTGAIAILEEGYVTLHKIPDTYGELWRLVPKETSFIVYEKVHSSPQQGPASAFTFGRMFGWVEAVAADVDVAYAVTPQQWQTALDCRTGGDKHISLEKAKKLFPDQKGITLKNADALLLAYYGWLKHGR